MYKLTVAFGLVGILLIGLMPSRSVPLAAQQSTFAADSAAVLSVVNRLHQALSAGDSATALALLAPDAVILESGGLETVPEYRAHHLPADIAFARAVRNQRQLARVTVRDNVAWVASTSTSSGNFQGRAVNSAGAELMVLGRAPDGWTNCGDSLVVTSAFSALKG